MSIGALSLLTLCSPIMRAADPAAPPAAVPEIPKDDVVVDDKTEAVIKGALKWLAAKQQPNGSWTTGRGNEHPVAMTGYTLMAMMAAGQLPGEGEHGKNVTKGMNYLLSCVRPDGYITNGGEGNMYNHGIAAIALAELYGQTKDPKLKQKLDLAIKLIVNCQNQQGGWRYRPAIVDGDISVTVLQLVAARAALNSGIEVPQSTIDKGVGFVKLCFHPSTGGFTYQPHGNLKTILLEDPTGRLKKEGDMTYWEPFDGQGVGPVYATAVYTTILAMPYHYIPLYQR